MFVVTNTIITTTITITTATTITTVVGGGVCSVSSAVFVVDIFVV